MTSDEKKFSTEDIQTGVTAMLIVIEVTVVREVTVVSVNTFVILRQKLKLQQ